MLKVVRLTKIFSVVCFASQLLWAAPVPSLSIDASDPLLGDNFSIDLSFDNTDASDTGYFPIFRFILPAELGYVSIDDCSGLGTSTVNTYTSNPATDPWTGESITLDADETLVVIRPPVGQLTPDQPKISCTVTASQDVSAVALTTYTITEAKAVFVLGGDPGGVKGDCGVGDTLCTTAATQDVTPQNMTLSKSSDQNSPIGTGSTYPINFTVSADLATGVTLNNVSVSDVLPDELVLTPTDPGDCSSFAITPAPTTCSYTADASSASGGTIALTYSSLSADASIGYAAYIRQFDDDLSAIVNPSTGASTSASNSLSFDADENPATLMASETVAVNAVDLKKSGAIKTDGGGSGLTPGDTYTWTTTMALSDYFQLDDIVWTDTVGDGQSYVDGTFSISVTEDASSIVVGEVAAETSGDYSHMVQGDGTTDLSLDLGAIMADTLNYSFPDTVLSGDATHSSGTSTSITISYDVTIDDTFDNDPGSGDLSQDASDDLDVPNAELDYDIVGGNSGLNVAAGASASIANINSFDLEITHVNGIAAGAPPINVEASDTVTFKATVVIPGNDAEDLKVTNYLPSPFFNVSTCPSYDGTLPPANNEWSFGTNDTGVGSGSVTVTCSATNNTVAFTFPDFDNAGGASGTVEISFTTTAQAEPIPDGLLQVNTAVLDYNDSTTSAQASAVGGVEFVGDAPIVSITHEVSSTDDGGASISAGDVTDIEAQAEITYSVDLVNSGATTAFDVTLLETLPAGFLPPAGSGACSGAACGYTITLGADCDNGGASTPDTTTNTDQTKIDIRDLQIAPGDTCTVTYKLDLEDDVQWGKEYFNVATTSFASILGGTTFPPEIDVTTIEIDEPTVDSSASVSSGEIGTEITYTVTVTLPQGQGDSSQIRLQESGGNFWGGSMASDFSTTVTGGQSGSGPYCSSSESTICWDNDATDSGSYNVSSSSQFYISLGSLENTDTDFTDDSVSFTITAPVLDTSHGSYSGRGRIRYNNGSNQTKNASYDAFTVIGPNISIDTCADATTSAPIDLTDDVGYIVLVKNSGSNLSTAFDVANVTETLQKGLAHTGGTVTASYCSAGASSATCSGWTTGDCSGTLTDVTATVRAGETVEASPFGMDDEQDLSFPVVDASGNPDIEADGYFVLEFSADVSCSVVSDSSGVDVPLGSHPDDDGILDACAEPVMDFVNTVDHSMNVASYSSLDGVVAGEKTYASENSNTVMLNMDHDGDGITNANETSGDADGDGVPNYLDTDADDNGTDDTTEGTGDADGDGTPDYRDTDDDNDGETDAEEITESGGPAVDTDGDGSPDYEDPDSDGDGISDGSEGTSDTDADSTKDYLDTDSDNDGIPDLVEVGLGSYDTNGDGKLSAAEITASTLDVDSSGAIEDDELPGGAFRDTDGDGTPDHLDLDSDNDGVSDTDEAQLTAFDDNSDNEVDAAEAADIDDGLGGDDVSGGANDDNNALDLDEVPDSDSDGTPDYIDTDSDNDGVPDLIENGRYVCDANEDGEVDYPGEVAGCSITDTDADGLLQLDESSQNSDGDGLLDYIDIDSDGDGIGDLIEAFGSDIDGDTDGEISAAEFTTAISSIGDMDGVLIYSELVNTDGDSGPVVPDMYDEDSDDDTILDLHESDATEMYPTYSAGSVVLLYSNLFDSEAMPDGTPDFRDLDSDDDDYPDEDEAGDAMTATVPVDLDSNNVPESQQLNTPIVAVDKCVTAASSGAAPITLSESIDYIVQVKNTGDRGAFDVTDVVDNLTQGLAYSATSVTAYYCSDDADTDSCEHDWASDGDCVEVSTSVRGGETIEASPFGGDSRQQIEFPVFDAMGGEPDIGANAYFVVKFTADLSCASAADSSGIDATPGTHSDNDGYVNGCSDPVMAFANTVSNTASVATYTIVDGSMTTRAVGMDTSTALNLDHDGDGILNSDEGSGDADGDGVPNYLDTDSDDDGTGDSTTGGVTDSDGDGTPNYRDTDDDNDGLSDGAELTISGSGSDIDMDGTNDELDPDSDGDGIADGAEGNSDTDSDGLEDSLDSDSDNDGIPDLIENGLYVHDTNNDGKLSAAEITASGLDTSANGAIEEGELPGGMFPDADGDGTPDYLDLDSDNDGYSDTDEAGLTVFDDDVDNEVDATEAADIDDGAGDDVSGGANEDNNVLDFDELRDSDGDGTPDHLDSDSDQDGIPDLVETGLHVCDANGNGEIDYPGEVSGCSLSDTDADGLFQQDEVAPQNTDSNGLPDYLDTDSDDDGIGDVVEAFGSDIDTNNDGEVSAAEYAVADATIGDSDGVLEFSELVNTDGDSGPVLPDMLDTDADNDGVLDIHESDETNDDFDNATLIIDYSDLFDSEAVPDGTPDFRETDSDDDGLLDSEEEGDGSSVTPPVDTDMDGDPDVRDLDSDDDGLTDTEEDTQSLTDPTDDDSDGDGCTDSCEVFGTNPPAELACPFIGHPSAPGSFMAPISDPNDADTDDGGSNDCIEAAANTDPRNGSDDPFLFLDPDMDGLLNGEEQTLGTDINNEDTDGDGVNDGCEVLGTTTGCTYDDPENSAWYPGPGTVGSPITDPLDTDSDDDGLSDGLETSTSNTDPNDTDTDDDGVEDGVERNLGTDPNDTDSDDDGLTDGEEVNTFGSDPLDTDTDDDGCLDDFEAENNMDINNDPDQDEDGLTECEEVGTHSTDPEVADTDDGGINDGLEVNTFDSDPLDPVDDCPNDRDADGDGVTDCEEIELGFDPADASDTTVQGSGPFCQSANPSWLLLLLLPLLMAVRRRKGDQHA